MNTDILLMAKGDSVSLAEGFRAARTYIAICEKRFTRFSEQSELSQLNRASGGWFLASQDLFDVVRQARRYMDQTCGLFDPSILVALRNAGYDRSMDEMRTDGAGMDSALTAGSWSLAGFDAVQFIPLICGIHLPEGVQIDLGGIAKGWIVERVAHLLASYAQACAVNAGGDMFLLGQPDDEETWPISLEDPRDPAQVLAVLRVRQGALATSSITKRRWVQGKRVQHHIIDPRSGEPADTDWLSVTVIADHATEAEVFAKALLIAGSAQAQVLAAQAPGIAFIGVKQDGSLWGSANSQEFLDVSGQTV
ncbi:MAG: FAD:protein FMN transferase [Chloroflexi bacterium]|nr:FAD:protein FMN transferase [Chloroflexota bacterium]